MVRLTLARISSVDIPRFFFRFLFSLLERLGRIAGSETRLGFDEPMCGTREGPSGFSPVSWGARFGAGRPPPCPGAPPPCC